MTLEEVIAKGIVEHNLDSRSANNLSGDQKVLIFYGAGHIAQAVRKWYLEQDPCPRCTENEI